jgi:hypothetical protein
VELTEVHKSSDLAQVLSDVADLKAKVQQLLLFDKTQRVNA